MSPMEKQILLQDVNLHYSSLAYRESSLKAHLFNLVKKKGSNVLQDVHALKNINLTISSGEKVALIGGNGAGKSSLLKTIMGLYPISSGTMVVRGRVRALLDIGLGFEHEATGRENILFRGLLQGKTPKEMREVENEVIAFADLGKFIDYPLKTYSSGMQIRLAFAISTLIDGEILLLDEFFGAGDANFLKKAKARINQLIDKTEILVFASHDFNAIREICNRAIFLEKGTILYDGPVEEAIQAYTNRSSSLAHQF